MLPVNYNYLLLNQQALLFCLCQHFAAIHLFIECAHSKRFMKIVGVTLLHFHTSMLI